MATNAERTPVNTEAFIPSPAMLAAAKRFKAAWEAGMSRSADGEVLTDRDIIEMHETSLALIWATATTNLEEALAVFHKLES
jgi:hypothetical protein